MKGLQVWFLEFIKTTQLFAKQLQFFGLYLQKFYIHFNFFQLVAFRITD